MRFKLAIPFLASVAVLGIAFGIAFVSLRGVRHLLIIHFDRFRGIDFFGERRDVFAVLGTGAALLGVNALLAFVWRKRDQFFAQLIAWCTLLVAVLILTAVGVILAVN